MDFNTKITILGLSLTYLQVTIILAVLAGGAYHYHMGPFRQTM